MKIKGIFIGVIIALVLVGCESGKVSKEENSIFRFTGTWKIDLIYQLDDENEGLNKDISSLVGEEFKIGEDEISILDEYKENIHYKLKVVKSDYILSYEKNLTMDTFIDGRESIDLISIIDKNTIIGEFFLKSDDEMILLYKSNLIQLSRLSKEANFNNDNINIKNKIQDEYLYSTEGVMLGIKSPRYEKSDGTYSNEEYRTLWVSHDNWNIGDIYEKENIIFPRMNGIWRLEVNQVSAAGFKYDEFRVSMYEDIVKDESDINVYLDKNEYKNIKFIGNDYIAIEKYVGDNFQGKCPIYQIIPINNINIEKGLSIDEIFNSSEKEKYLSEFNLEIERLSNEKNSELDILNIDYSNIAIERRIGKWMFVANILPNNISEKGEEVKVSMIPGKKFINYNSLYISWKILKGELGFFKDAFISPLGKIALIQFDNYIAVYKIESGIIITEPLSMIPIDTDEEVIMAEWCDGSYVKQWEKVFSDGKLIIQN